MRYDLIRLAGGLLLGLSVGVVRADAIVLEQDGVTVTATQLQRELELLPAEQRAHLAREPRAAREFLSDLYLAERMARAAEAQGYLERPALRAELAKHQRELLARALLADHQQGFEAPDYEALARTQYRAFPDRYRSPERLRVAHILFQVRCACEDEDGAKRALAETVRDRARAGEDFAELAQEFSEDPGSAAAGGALPDWVTRGQLVPPFEEAAFALAEPGAISEVVETHFGYHVIRLLARESEAVKPFEAVRDDIVRQLQAEHREKRAAEFLVRFQADRSRATFDEDLLDRLLRETDAP
ncbi:MAG: peptidylprolyl isomerase [Candidatus Competibacteraceae bacterium]